MVTVVVERDGEGRILGFSMSGHAGFAEAGRDIICAAVSAVAQTAVLGLRRFGGKGMSCVIEPGRLSCRWSVPMRKLEPAWYIVETMLLGLGDIAKEHPDHVHLSMREV
ncbi:MAG TPA: ribosomal-processing cysteine protease Prp [Clostridiales bacterium UBA8153]|nr:ribosomal-processing cysteine protease Prp [Clostridiales bacterium UBA8153]